MKQAMGPLGDAQGFAQIVRDNIKPSSITTVNMDSVKAWLAFTKAFLEFPKDVTPEAVFEEIVWSKACQ